MPVAQPGQPDSGEKAGPPGSILPEPPERVRTHQGAGNPGRTEEQDLPPPQRTARLRRLQRSQAHRKGNSVPRRVAPPRQEELRNAPPRNPEGHEHPR